jgi:hypothetical protein
MFYNTVDNPIRELRKQYLSNSAVVPISGTKFDADKMLEVYDECIRSKFKNHPQMQVAITSSDGKAYGTEEQKISNVSLGVGENQYNLLNEFFIGTYIETVHNTLFEMFGGTRGRFMVLNKHKRAYSYHSDLTPRLHIPVTTNRDCKFIVDDVVYYLPDVGQLYMVDTTRPHSALNLGYEERLHIVYGITDIGNDYEHI